MDKNLSSAGFDLLEIEDDKWLLNIRGGDVFIGSFKRVVKHAVGRMGFEMSEIEIAVREMLARDHNGAHFGVYKKFIFSFQKDFTNVKKAG